MVEELLGPNLSALIEKLPASVVLPPYLPRLADEMSLCIEDFHRFGSIHRDIKPQNFVIRLSWEFPLCLIDYGIARQYQSATGQHIGAREVAGAVGSPVYASLSVHNGQDCSRRDGLISWLYSVLAISQHRLPWLGLDLPREEVARQKTEWPLTRLARELSGGFQAVAAHIEGLGFADTPDYKMMHEQLRRDMPAVGVPFEWMDVDPEGGTPGGNCDPSGFLLKISPWLRPHEKEKCLLLET
jgi:serine/threonine protein kinase